MVFGKRPAAATTFAFDESKQQQGSGGEAGTQHITQQKKKKKAVKLKSYRHLKSPYNTNIINDPDVIPAASVENQLKNMLTAPKASKLRKDKSKTDQADIYETFIAADMVKRIRKCWTLMCTGMYVCLTMSCQYTLQFTQSGNSLTLSTHTKHSYSLPPSSTLSIYTLIIHTQRIQHYSIVGCPPP